MTESEREKEFPIHIELGKSADMGDFPMTGKSDSKGKKKKFYPTLYVSDVEGLEDIPEEGCILIDFKRRSINVRKSDSGKTTTSVELEVRTICMPNDYESEGDMDDVVEKMVKKSSRKSEEDDEDDNE